MLINITPPQLAGIVTGTTAAATGTGCAVLSEETHKTLTAACIALVISGVVLATSLINRAMTNADAEQRVRDYDELQDRRAREATEFMGTYFARMAREMASHGAGQDAILKLVRVELDALRDLAASYDSGGPSDGGSGPTPVLRVAQ